MDISPTRRRFLGWLGVTAAMPIVAGCGISSADAKTYPVHFSDAQWRKRLTSAQFAILRQEGTEAPFSSPLLNEHRKGTFCCAADGNPVYDSSTKFDSGTGWPSFWKPLPGGVETKLDLAFRAPRYIVRAAAGISGMSLMTGRPRPASAIAWTAWRSAFDRPDRVDPDRVDLERAAEAGLRGQPKRCSPTSDASR
jgi:peptide-methionine (R)-S-oxide reductase